MLDLLARANGPVSAHGIARHAAVAGHRIAPNQVYRTLSRLTGLDRVRRVEAISAYVLSSGDVHACLICNDCRSVRLVCASDLAGLLVACAEQRDFTVDRVILEIPGRCSGCAAALSTLAVPPAIPAAS